MDVSGCQLSAACATGYSCWSCQCWLGGQFLCRVLAEVACWLHAVCFVLLIVDFARHIYCGAWGDRHVHLGWPHCLQHRGCTCAVYRMHPNQGPQAMLLQAVCFRHHLSQCTPGHVCTAECLVSGVRCCSRAGCHLAFDVSVSGSAFSKLYFVMPKCAMYTQCTCSSSSCMELDDAC